MTRTGLRQHAQGFTLIELMITVMVLGILAAIAYPQYGQYVTKARRTEAKAALARVQGAQERYFTVNNKYSSNPADLKVLACAAQTTGSGDTCDQGSHVITIAVTGGADATGYTLTAAPKLADALCGTLGIDNLNTKTETGTGGLADCW